MRRHEVAQQQEAPAFMLHGELLKRHLLPMDLEELATPDELLEDHARDANHAQAGIDELLGLHLDLLLRSQGVQV